MSLKNLIPLDKFEKLLLNGLPENCNDDHYPVAFLSSATSRQQWFISQIKADNSSIAYALYYTPAQGIASGFINIEEIIATDTSIKYIDYNGEMEISVYEFAAEVEGYITVDYNHLCDAVNSMEIEHLHDVINVSG